MGRLNKYVSDKNKLLVVAGVINSRRAFIGPEVLHIDLTNTCNFNCIACWCRSPLLEDKTMPDWEKKLTLPLETIKKVLDDLAKMGGLRQVKLVGGGEPFMHQGILEIISYIKSKDKNIEIDINTNFSLVNEEVVDKLLELGVDSFTVSIWAGTQEAFLATHPNQTKDTFLKIKKVLTYLFECKKQTAVCYPRVRIHNVIMKLNYRDILQMIEFALDVGADEIQFVPVDPVKDKTETLLLNQEEKKELLGNLNLIKQRYSLETFRYVSSDGRQLMLPGFEGFIKRIEKVDTVSGAYDEERVQELPCYVGWLFARIMATGNVVPCCKGHRMIMGNVHKDRFNKIWSSRIYREFRNKAKSLSKSHPYFSLIGNDASKKTGCYNCDNLWQNEPMHRLMRSIPLKNKKCFLF